MIEDAQDPRDVREPGLPESPRGEGLAPAAGEPTGNAEVDAVLASLGELDAVPLSDHVKLFEQAHDRLRGALATAAETPPVPPAHG